MSTEHKLYWIMGGIGALLITASLIAWILSQRARSEAGRATVDNLIDRINAWWWMAGLLLVVGWLGTGAVITLFALTSFFALREFITLTPTRPGDHRALFWVFFLFTPLQYILVGIGAKQTPRGLDLGRRGGLAQPRLAQQAGVAHRGSPRSRR